VGDIFGIVGKIMLSSPCGAFVGIQLDKERIMLRKHPLDLLVRTVQNITGPNLTHDIQNSLPPGTLQFVRELIRRRARHRVQIRRKPSPVAYKHHPWYFHPDLLHTGSVVYSLGVGEQIDFEVGLIAEYNVVVYGFDPTPIAVTCMANLEYPRAFNFIPCGIASFDGIAEFVHHRNDNYLLQRSRTDQGLPVRRLQTMMKRLGHSRLDMLKINIEGSEYEVLADLLASDIIVDQLLVEFHHRFSHINLSQTEAAVQQLNKHGYQISYISDHGIYYTFLHQRVAAH
jgi:FkbM family methyltransferase